MARKDPAVFDHVWRSAVIVRQSRPLIATGAAALARGNGLAERPEDLGRLPADPSGQRVAASPGQVRAQRDGRPPRRGRRARATQQSLSLPGPARRAQAGAVHVSARARWKDLFQADFEVLLYESHANRSCKRWQGAAPHRGIAHHRAKGSHGHSRPIPIHLSLWLKAPMIPDPHATPALSEAANKLHPA
jgi:hypothetical protein